MNKGLRVRATYKDASWKPSPCNALNSALAAPKKRQLARGLDTSTPGLVGPLCTQAHRGWWSYLNTHWVFINSFCNTDHSRAEVLVTFISVSDASQQLSHPEMLVATGWPQSEL